MKYYIYKIKNDKVSIDENTHNTIQTIINAGQHSLISINSGEQGIYTGDIKGWELDDYATKLDESHQLEPPKLEGNSPFQEALKKGRNALYKKMGWENKSRTE